MGVGLALDANPGAAQRGQIALLEFLVGKAGAVVGAGARSRQIGGGRLGLLRALIGLLNRLAGRLSRSLVKRRLR